MSNDVMGLPLIGPDMHTWGVVSRPESYNDDGLVALRPRQHTDASSSMFSERLIDVLHFFKRLYRGKKRDNSMVGHRDTTISKITFWLTSFIASTLPVISIIALANIPSPVYHLATISGFNGLVSLCLGWFTEARRTDIFARTAVQALIAVQLGCDLTPSIDSRLYRSCFWAKHLNIGRRRSHSQQMLRYHPVLAHDDHYACYIPYDSAISTLK